jgi:hypothetical protein
MGTGYTRQSSADIVTGVDITAAPLNAEFNALQTAFDSSTGHTHDGTSGEGPLIGLTTSITGVLPVTNGGFAAIHKIDATTAPTSGDDSGSGYGPGSIWVDTTNDSAYVCLDASVANAVWDRISFSASLDDISALAKTDGNIIVGNGTNWVTESGATARTTLGLTIGTDVQAYNAGLADIAGLAKTDSNIIVGDGTNWVAESGATARTSLGLGSIATQASSAVSINGGTITGITDLAVADGGTGASTAGDARTNLGVVIGTDVQAYDAGLQSISGLTTAADKMIYTTASDTYAVANLTTAGRALIDDADASAQLTTLGVSTYAKTLLDDTDASVARTTLGLGTFSVENTAAIAADIIPDADGTRDLGSATYRFAELHVDNINGGALSGFRNRLQNPLFQVDIEGNAGGVTTNAAHVVEGWRTLFSNGVTTQTTSRVTGDSVPYAIRYAVTTGSDASIAAGDYVALDTAIEGYDISDALWGTANAKSVRINGRIKAPTTGTYCVSVQNVAFTRSYVFEVACTASTWVDFEKEIPGDTSGTWDKTTGKGLYLAFGIAFGSTYHTTADTWAAGSFFGTSSQANGLATNGNVFEIENIRVSVGGPIPTEWRPYSLDLAHCQRYYQTGLIRFDSSVAAGANYSVSAYLPVVMRSAPTVVWTNDSAVTFSATVNALLALPYMVAAFHTSSGAGGANFQDSFTASARMI